MNYKDIADLPEDDRISLIGRSIMERLIGKEIAFVTDDEKGKADRYVRKLVTLFPKLREVRRMAGPVVGVVSVIMKRIG